MESIAETMSSNWTGSQKTAEMIRNQIMERFGPEAAKLYDPTTNALTFREASKRGYRVKKGETSLKSITFIEADGLNGQKKKFYKTVHLFFLPFQCEKV
jgi:hypothetical protein